ncbi:MAG: hypothetical protein LUE92_12185 [Clostridiales bacterium]|nr:hypothetical protein [Clostridiales bacterium]
MNIQFLTAEDAFAEIARLEQEREEGVVVNIAEKMWCGCGAGDAYHEKVRAEYGAPVFHGVYRPEMTDIIFPGDLCIAEVSRKPKMTGHQVFRAAWEYLTGRGVPVNIQGSDFILFDLSMKQPLKIGSYGATWTDNKMFETTIHFSINADRDIIERIRREKPEMIRGELGSYGVTADELWEAVKTTML